MRQIAQPNRRRADFSSVGDVVAMTGAGAVLVLLVSLPYSSCSAACGGEWRSVMVAVEWCWLRDLKSASLAFGSGGLASLGCFCAHGNQWLIRASLASRG